nr:polysaccharide deacetylase family protein [Halomarina salina]
MDDYTFALCLTHDVDRLTEGYRGLYYALRNRDPSRLRTLHPQRESYWQFDTIVDLEASLGVRSSFNVLVEKDLFAELPPREWVKPRNWLLYRGRYDVQSPAVADTVRQLDAGGWEVGLHGSYDSYRDTDRLRYEKGVVESVVDHEIRGGRQHYLNLDVPETWHRHADVGLGYDTTLGASQSYGFDHGYGVRRPFDDFLVFPLTLMDIALPDVSNNPERAWRECERLLAEARDNGAVMTVDWHQRCFSETAFPYYGRLYRALVERALEMGAWVGPPGDLYEYLQEDAETLERLTTTEDGPSPSLQS